jgi:uncharacterized SAM-binding protein YcdF (DUF218 family)
MEQAELGARSKGLSGKGKAPGGALWLGAALLAAIALVGFAPASLFRGVASFLIVEDRLEPAAAIVALGGQAPFRQIEAARLYHAGWAPLVFVVQEGPSDEASALRELGIEVLPEWELSRQVLLRRGVPASAIVVPREKSIGTLEELQAVYGALRSKDAPVILVTSKFHTRRASLTWNYVTQGRSKAIVRAAGQDPFDPTRWWRERRFALAVVREYLGLVNYYAGFPVAAS